jgi:ATP-dependent Clp protease ATP-binding subunit ClpC
VYPFDRFTDGAQRVLTWSQEEAEAAGHRYIGTEHLALALCRDRSDLAGVVLGRMGVHAAAVRELRERPQAEPPGGPLEKLLPSARLKRVIELAIEESRRMGQPVVATEHLLLGLLIDSGQGAQALAGLGVTLDRTRDLVRAHSGGTLPDHYGDDLRQVLFAASRLAERDGDTQVTLDHVRRALADAPGDDSGPALQS